MDSAGSTDLNMVAKKFPLLTLLYINSGTDLSSICGAECLTKLEFLSIPGAKINDIEPIRGLTNLRFIDFGQTLIRRIDALSGKLKLRSLVINDTAVTSIEPIRQCAKLDTLFATGVQLQSLAPLDELPLLAHLYVDSNAELTAVLLARQREGALKIVQLESDPSR